MMFKQTISFAIFVCFLTSALTTLKKNKKETKTNTTTNHSPNQKNNDLRRSEDERPFMDVYNVLNLVVPLIQKAGESIPLFGEVIGVFHFWIEHLKPEQSLWDQVKSQVKVEIENHLKEYHFSNLQKYWAQLAHYSKESYPLTEKELFEIIYMKSRFFPQTYGNTLPFTPIKFCAAIISYFTYLNGAFWKLMDSNPSQKEALKEKYYKQLEYFREDIIQAARALHRKRYENLKGTSYSGGQTASSSAKLVFKDLYNNEEKSELIKEVDSKIFDSVKKKTSKIIMDVLVDKVNAFFIPTLCETSCPKIIEEKDIDVSYDGKCFGKVDNNSNRDCSLPCDDYGGSYDWCPYYPYGLENNIFGVNSQKCKKMDWISDYSKANCIPLKPVNGVPDKKKAKKTKLKKKKN